VLFSFLYFVLEDEVPLEGVLSLGASEECDMRQMTQDACLPSNSTPD
jgi:hypothetical protein